MTLRREMDIVANNIANADTTGFKVEVADRQGPSRRRRPDARRPRAGQVRRRRRRRPRLRPGRPAPDRRAARPGHRGPGLLQGHTRRTASATPATAASPLDATGQLVTQAGEPVLDEGGGEIILDPPKGQVTIAPDGTISQGDRARRQGRRVQLRRPRRAREGRRQPLPQHLQPQPPRPPPTPRVRQGMLESSNVKPILQITRMIEVSRAYEQIAKHDGPDQPTSIAQAIQRLGRVAVRSNDDAERSRTAATGMAAQQLNVEVISNNIANMNTVGFKRQRAEFQDLLYQTIERPGAQSSDQGTIVPTGVQVGAGVKAGSVYRITDAGLADPHRQQARPGDPGPRLLPGADALGRDRLHPRRQLLGQRPGPAGAPGRLPGAAGDHDPAATPPTSPSPRPARCR